MEENQNNLAPKGSMKYTTFGIILFALIVLAGGYLYNNSDLAANIRKNVLRKNTDFTQLKVVPIGSNGFGSLAVATVTSGSSSVAFGKGGGGVPTMSMPAPAAGEAGSSSAGVAVDKMMIAPIQANQYVFKYSGDAVELTESSMAVLRRVKGTLRNNSAADALKGFDFGSINLGSFQNSSLDSFSISQDIDHGYSINVSFPEDSISIYQNWQKWMRPECIQTGCSQPPLQIGDLPEDQVVIDIANQFIKDHSINTAPYGQPYVMNNFRVIYYAAPKTMQSEMYVPDQVQVMYPLVIDDKNVYDASGNPTGLSISVDVRSKKVAGLWQLTSHTYQASNYDAETDFAKLQSLAEKGGLYGSYGYYPADQKNVNVVTLELEKPTIQWMTYWMQNGVSGDELYVPALVFRIKDAPADMYQKNVIVPLIKDVLNAVNNPVGKPIPLERGAGDQ